MRTIVKLILPWSVVFVSMMASANSYNGFIGVASDYVFRGISQSSEDPAFQAGFKVDLTRRWYLEGFISEVDVNGASVEFELAGGLQGSLSKDFKYQAELNYSIFTNEAGSDADYLEAEFRLYFRRLLTFTLAHTNDLYGSSEAGTYFEGKIQLPLHDVIKTVAYVGNYTLDSNIGDNYVVYGFDALTQIGDIDFKLSFTDTDIANVDTADSRLFFSASYHF